MGCEQTTIRLPAEMKKELQQEADRREGKNSKQIAVSSGPG